MKRFSIFVVGILILACGGGSETSSENSEAATSIFTGTISGLSGTLIFKNNLGEEETMTTNGSFEFETALAPNADYTLTILEEPCPQRCTIDQSAGKIGSDGKAELSIICDAKSWSYPTIDEPISFASYTDTSNIDASVSMNKYGDTLILWAQANAAGESHLYKKENRNREWINPGSIDAYFSNAGSEAIYRSGSINDDGEATIAWVQSNGIDDQIYAGQYLSNRWIYRDLSEPLSVLGKDVLTDSNSTVIVKSNNLGESVVVWVQDAGEDSDRGVYVALYNSIWNFPSTSSDNISPEDHDASIESIDVDINDLGDIVVVWEQSNTTNSQIYKAEYRGGFWISIPTDRSDHISLSGTDAHVPKVALDNLGNAMIVWNQKDADDGDWQIFVSQLRSGQDWDNPSSLSDNISSNGHNGISPRVTMNNLDHAIVVWRQSDSDGNYQIMKREYQSGIDSTGAVQISPEDAGESTDCYYTNVGLDDSDNAVIVWKQESIDDSGVYHTMKAEKHPDTDWVFPSSLNDQISPGSSHVNTPVVTVNNCRATIIWRQEENDGQFQYYMAEYR